MSTDLVSISEEQRVPVQIRIPTILRPDAGGQAIIEANGATLSELFADLTTRFPGLKDKVITEEGQLHKFVNVYVNDDDVRYLDKLDTTVAEGDTVTILPAVAGG
ncbi:MAG TPA: ubiquitin-like small modifier protein 1 [Acidimicrobiales bacterium]|nr:ubiquitin-like small modifier protein 1 [Acidimicrobiales bacterium]